MNQQIIIFGASVRGKYVYEKMKKTYDIIGFADNDCDKWGKVFCDKKIINPKELKNYAVRVMVASMYQEEIYEQLVEMGLKDISIYPSSIECVFETLKSTKNILLNEISVLSVFGGQGTSIEKYIEDRVRRLEIWEIDKSYAKKLKENISKATIKCVDSFKQIREIHNKYDMILMDNPMGVFNGHCEHFDMFLECFNVLGEEGILIFDILPNLKDIPERFIGLQESMHLLARKLFYRSSDPLNISVEHMVGIYKEICKHKGYEIEWYFTEERSQDFVQFMVLKISKFS